MHATQTEITTYTQRLSEAFKLAPVVYVNIRSVSRSGMSRTMSIYVVIDGALVCVDSLANTICRYPRAKREGITVRGCGMDMGFAVVNDVSRSLGMDHTPRHEFI